MKKLLGLGFGVLVASLVALQGTSSALTPDYGRIIDDDIFDNNTMSAGQIDSFLNSFPSSCISPNNHFQAPDPTGYSPNSGFTYGGNVSAGQVIYDAAQAYGLNPQVLLATLQKEESLVDGSAGCSTLRYTSAVGYGCPDGGASYNYSGLNLYTLNGTTVTSVSGTCVNTSSKAGFTQQLIRAAWLFTFDQHRSEGQNNWYINKPGWDNSDDLGFCYSGYAVKGGPYYLCPDQASHASDPYVSHSGQYVIDSQVVTITNGATAALFDYTPHLHGQDLFATVFTNWFGPTTSAGFNWQYVSQGQYTDNTESTPLDPSSLIAGQRYYVSLTAKNTGWQTWTKGVVNLGTTWPTNRTSTFRDPTWLSGNRAATMDQSSVAPGDTATFSFWITAPNQPGTYKETFDLVADGYTWMTDLGQYWQFTVAPQRYTWQYISQNAYTDSTEASLADIAHAAPGQRYYLTLTIKNTGNMSWQRGSMNLGTSGPNDRVSAFRDSSWPSGNRAATLDQLSVAPGSNGTFSFWMQAPISRSSGGNYKEYFTPVIDGITWLADYGVYWQFGLPRPQYTWQILSQNAYTDQTMTTLENLGDITHGQRFYLTAQLKNISNMTWQPGIINLGTSGPNDRVSAFRDSSWPSGNRAASVASVVLPGQTTTIGFWVTAPNTAGTYKEYFDLVADGYGWFIDYGMYYGITIH